MEGNFEGSSAGPEAKDYIQASGLVDSSHDALQSAKQVSVLLLLSAAALARLRIT
jgi:hypothetical protein